MPIENTISVESIMSQAQVFASAWSLVGGPFDHGDALENAEEAKEELREMVAEFCSKTELKDVAELCIRWHSLKIGNIEQVLATPPDTEVRLGEDDPIVLSGDKLKGFRLGLALAKEWFGEFPLSIERPGEDVDE